MHSKGTSDDDICWATKEGERLLPSEFDNAHLINTIKFIERSAWKYRERRLCSLLADIVDSIVRGDEARYFIRDTIEEIRSTSPEEFIANHEPIYIALCNEAIKRNLIYTGICHAKRRK